MRTAALLALMLVAGSLAGLAPSAAAAASLQAGAGLAGTSAGAVLAATDPAGNVLTTKSSGAGWTPWADLGGPALGAPALATTSTGAGDVIIRDPANRVLIHPLGPGAWASLGGATSAAPGATWSPVSGYLVAVRGLNGAVYSRYAGRASAWRDLGGSLQPGAGPAVAAIPGGFAIAVTGSAGGVFIGQLLYGRWSGWSSVGGLATGGPGLAVGPGGGLVVFARTSAGSLAVRSQSGRTWSSWLSLGGQLTSSPTAAGAPYTVRVVVRGPGGVLYQRFAETHGWSPWTVISPSTPAAPSAELSVRGNELVNGAGMPVTLAGVNRSGTEYACIQGWGTFDGPSDLASVQAMQSWAVQIVRVPLNEDCWLGINGVSATLGGAAYRQAIVTYVQLLRSQGLFVDLELHWNAPGATPATGQQVMADADHSPAFWTSVADTFKADRGVVFELYNEPHDITWQCWRDGCLTSAGWQAAGMQQLVDTVRSTGAQNVILLGGLGWSSDDSQWLTWRPSDPTGQLAAAVHIYNFSGCAQVACWTGTLAPLAAQVPLVTTEFGESDCAGGFVTSYMNWADSAHVSYLGWTWDTWDCSSGPALITSYDGTPTAYGAAVRTHFLSRH